MMNSIKKILLTLTATLSLIGCAKVEPNFLPLYFQAERPLMAGEKDLIGGSGYGLCSEYMNYDEIGDYYYIMDFSLPAGMEDGTYIFLRRYNDNTSQPLLFSDGYNSPCEVTLYKGLKMYKYKFYPFKITGNIKELQVRILNDLIRFSIKYEGEKDFQNYEFILIADAR